MTDSDYSSPSSKAWKSEGNMERIPDAASIWAAIESGCAWGAEMLQICPDLPRVPTLEPRNSSVFNGRGVKGYEADASLKEWVTLGITYALSLPPK